MFVFLNTHSLAHGDVLVACGTFGTQALAGRCKSLGIDTESFSLALLSIESHDDQPQWGFNGTEGITPTSRDSVSTAAMRQNMSLLLSIVFVAYVPYPATIMKKIKTIKGCLGRWGRQWICIKISRSMCHVKPFGYIVYLFSCSSLILNLLYMVLFLRCIRHISVILTESVTCNDNPQITKSEKLELIIFSL